MKIAVTGTPGVGKTSACALVSSLRVVHVNDLVDELGVVSGYDRKRRTKEVDVKKLAKAVAKMDGDAIFEGHFSHMLGVDSAIVLRCSPKVLDKRLRKKRWPEKKIRENIEAEAVDVDPRRDPGERRHGVRDRHDPEDAEAGGPRDREDCRRGK